MKFAGLDWDSGNLSKCLEHGVALGQIEALFAGTSTSFATRSSRANDGRSPSAPGPADGYSAFSLGAAKRSVR